MAKIDKKPVDTLTIVHFTVHFAVNFTVHFAVHFAVNFTVHFTVHFTLNFAVHFAVHFTVHFAVHFTQVKYLAWIFSIFSSKYENKKFTPLCIVYTKCT